MSQRPPAPPPPPGSPEPPPLPVLRLDERRGHTRFLLLAGAALLILVLFRILTAHPLPPPSHRSSEAAVTGYLDGLQHRDLGQIERYLEPNQRHRAGGMLKALAAAHAYISGPAVSSVAQAARAATVVISVDVCSPLPGHRGDSCIPVSHEPLGLPDQLNCVRLKGGWYVTTLFKPS